MIENLQDESKSKTNNVLYLGNKIDAKAMLKGGIQKNVPAFQSAVYKSPKENFSDFYNQVFEKENDAKANNTTVKKSYFQYNNNGLSVRIPHATVIHDNNNHSLSSTEWETFLDNLQNPVDAVVSSGPRFNGTPILLKYKIGNSYYGAVIEFFNKKQPIIATAFIDKEENIDKWLKKNSHSQAKNTSSVTTKGMLLSNDYNNIISYVKQKLNPTEFINNNIKENFGYSAEELENNFKADIKNILEENGIDYDEFEIEDVRLYGSYTTGKYKDTSDLDVIVQYKGKMKEDAAFNIFSDENLTITDVNGVERKVDINPINRELSGTIDEHIERMHEIDSAYFQSANTAGAETSAEISDAIKEWQEKGTDSKYFKRWFGDSKVVDENGKPLVVYHGSPNATFDEFRNNSHFTKNKDYAEIYKNQGASSLGYKKTADNPNVYEVYLSIKNPFDTRDKKARDIFLNEYQAYYSPDLTDKGMVDLFEVEDLTEWLKENYPEYDGIFADEGGVGGYGDDVLDRGISYIPFNPEQIKSVDNRGTFDEGNANIYYQSNYKNNGNIVDLTDDFETTPTSEDVKKYINELVESGKKFATLSPDWFVDVKGGAKKKAHIIKSSNFSKMNKVERKRHKKYIMSLEKLLANAEYSGEKENTKKAKKPNIAKYHYFTTNVRVGDKIYKVVFDTEEYKNEISSSSANVLRSVKNLDEDNNSITDNTENINPTTITIREMLNGVKDADSKLYFQESNNPLDKARGFSTVRQDVFVFLQSLIF